MARSSLARAAKKIMDAVKESSSVERDPFHRFCEHLGGEPHLHECRLPDGIIVNWKARRSFDPEIGIHFEQYLRVAYKKEYDEVLGDPVSDIVERKTGGVCTVEVNTEYGAYTGGSVLICSKDVDIDGDYLRNTELAIDEVRGSAETAERVIGEVEKVLKERFM